MLPRSARPALALLALALWPAAAHGASLWTQLPTPNGHTISAIAFPTATELVFATTAGEIYYRTATLAFARSKVTPANRSGFTAIAMSSSGVSGVAVGRHGTIYHSTDSGLSWSAVTATEPSGPCPSPSFSGPLVDDLLSVRFADPSTVYVTGKNGDVLKSSDTGATFTEVNKLFGGCVVDPGGSQGFTDTAWTDANSGFLLSGYQGRYFSTADGLATASSRNSLGEDSETPGKLALAATNPNHAWVVANGSTRGPLFRLTTDGGNTWASPRYDGIQVTMRDIATAGGAVVTAGDGGGIYTSPDGQNFYRQVAAPPNTGNAWRAVAMLDASHAVVGGAGGVLIYTARANQAPDTIPPTGTISGPIHLAPGQSGTFTARATDNPGGTGVDPAAYTWSAPGQSSRGSASATFSFTAPGLYVITVDFRDLAGNANTAYLRVRVTSPRPSGSHRRVHRRVHTGRPSARAS